jgi:NAD(P)-dependent dehydrogenase (short-subunit alcohol dehydrogenase family)
MDGAAPKRVAVVTGAGRGLGRAVSVALAERGHPLVGVARNPAQLAETAELVRGSGGRMLTRPMDVADIEGVAQLGEFVRAQLGPPAILVNAAGMFGPIAFIRDTSPEEWVRTVMVDGIAPYLTIQQFVGGMIDAGWGRIVNITSAASLHPPGPLNSAYGTAKVALNQLTRHLAAELEGTGVTANVIHPGDVKTEMWEDIRDKVATLGREADGFKEWAAWVEETGGDPPEKAVRLVLRLTSDEGADTNGQFCWVDDPLQAPIPSWGEGAETQPWRK